MKSQELLLKTIQKKLQAKESLLDVIATILHISYDAAHRRVSLKSKFSIEEAVQLCLHYDISMDNIIRNNNKLVVEKTKEVHQLPDLLDYFKDSFNHLKEFQNLEGVRLYYSAKDIPLFYTIGGSLLSKFKLYVWTNLLIENESIPPFEQFYLSTNLQEYSGQLMQFYENIEVHEIWNDTTINSTVQQIFYFFESGLLVKETTIILYQELINLLQKIESKCSVTQNNYHLYYNELLILNNNVIVGNSEKKKLFVPYTMLGYFITDDEKTTQNTQHFFHHQIKNSKSLNLSGTRDRKIFFNRALQKINYYIEKIETYHFE